MARPKRMGAYNALDDLTPGIAWDPDPALPAGDPAPPPPRPRLEPVPDPPRRSRHRARGRLAAGSALDDLLPGPRGRNALDDLLPGPGGAAGADPAAGPPGPPRRRPGPDPRGRGLRRHLEVWNPLDAVPPPAPPAAAAPAKARARVSLRLPADLVETARDAVAHLAGTADQTTLSALAERALRAELARLADAHRRGRPFPPRAR
jgi:hypothetical protein